MRRSSSSTMGLTIARPTSRISSRAGDPRVRVVRNAKPLGLPGNWDRCIDLAQGEWVKFLFQDDVLSPRCVERLHAAVRPGVDIVVCRRAAVAEPGVADGSAQEYATYVATHDLSRRFPHTTFVTPAQFAAHVVDHPTANCIGATNGTLIRRSAFDRFGRFPPGPAPAGRLVKHAARIAVQTGLCYVDEALVTISSPHLLMATVRQSRGSRFRTVPSPSAAGVARDCVLAMVRAGQARRTGTSGSSRL